MKLIVRYLTTDKDNVTGLSLQLLGHAKSTEVCNAISGVAHFFDLLQCRYDSLYVTDARGKLIVEVKGGQSDSVKAYECVLTLAVFILELMGINEKKICDLITKGELVVEV